MTINPKVSFYINIALASLGIIAGSSGYFTDMWGTSVATKIVETAGFTVAIFSAVNGVLHAYSAPVAGLMVSKDVSH